MDYNKVDKKTISFLGQIVGEENIIVDKTFP